MTFEYHERDNYWTRLDCHPGECSDVVFVTDQEDTSPAHNSVTQYDARCSWCYLGHCHSEQQHTRRV